MDTLVLLMKMYECPCNLECSSLLWRRFFHTRIYCRFTCNQLTNILFGIIILYYLQFGMLSSGACWNSGLEWLSWICNRMHQYNLHWRYQQYQALIVIGLWVFGVRFGENVAEITVQSDALRLIHWIDHWWDSSFVVFQGMVHRYFAGWYFRKLSSSSCVQRELQQ